MFWLIECMLIYIIAYTTHLHKTQVNGIDDTFELCSHSVYHICISINHFHFHFRWTMRLLKCLVSILFLGCQRKIKNVVWKKANRKTYQNKTKQTNTNDYLVSNVHMLLQDLLLQGMNECCYHTLYEQHTTCALR